MRARNVMGSKTVASRWYPQVPVRSVYVRGKGVVKRKRVISRGCRARGVRRESVPFSQNRYKPFIYNILYPDGPFRRGY
jgi:hypothetical protein